MGQLNRCVCGAFLAVGIALGLTLPLAEQSGADESHGGEVLSSMPEANPDNGADVCLS